MPTFISAPTISGINADRFYDLVREISPPLANVLMALEISRVNPMILPNIIRAIGKMHSGTRYGKITIYMQNGKITAVEGVEYDKIEEEAVVEEK